MKEITSNLLHKFTPERVITIYKDVGYQYYVESQEVEKGKLLQAHPLSEDMIADMVEYFSDKSAKRSDLKGWISPSILYCEWNATNRILIWTNQPQERMMYFTGNLKIGSGLAWQPTLVYVLKNGLLNVFVSKSKVIDLNTKLYIAPYHNCSSNGSVCTGNYKLSKIKNLSYASITEYYEKVFWNTEFSHLSDSETIFKENINNFWKAAIKNKTKFNSSLLIESKQSFKSILK